jgi:hypothetical protein
MQKILKSLIKGIGALPIDFKGKIAGKEFVIKVQYKLDGSVGAQVWSGKDIIIELEGRSGEVEKKTQTFLDWAVEKKEQDLYKKKMLDFFKQVHKEVVDYNKKQGVKKKAEPKKYWLLIKLQDGGEFNWYQKSGLKVFPGVGFPVGRFVIYKKGVYDTKTGVNIMNIPFGVEDTLGRFERGMKYISDPEKFVERYAETTKREMVAKGTWPGDKPTSSESVIKAAPKKAKVDVFKAPVVEKKEVKAAPKKVAARATKVAPSPNKEQEKIQKDYEHKMKAGYIISSYSGYFYVIDRNTGARLINKSFRDYDDALRAAKELPLPTENKKFVVATKKKEAKKTTKVKEPTKAKSTLRQTGSSNLAKDKQRKAQGPGKRKSSETGEVYYEYRRNRTDKPGSNV